jgi:tetratricopeptide (TPR) repeat protein
VSNFRGAVQLADAQRTQRDAVETLERTKYRTAIIRSQAEQDEIQVAENNAMVDEILAKCQESVRNARHVLKECRSALQSANTVLDTWKTELQKAIEWLKRAQTRLQRAIAEYEAARRAFIAAQRELEYSVSSLRSCVNSTERRDCRGEQRRVERAQFEVREAARRVEIAEAEVLEAKAEVARAQARVNCCTEAVKNATIAVSHATTAAQSADDALNSGERGLEYAQAAYRVIQQAQAHLQNELDEIEQMTLMVGTAGRAVEDAALQMKSAERLESSAHRYATDVGYELRYRVENLIAFNRPEQILDSSGTISSSVNESFAAVELMPVVSAWIYTLTNLGGGHGWRYQQARQTFLRGLAEDDNQPAYVRGWIKQELNRLERVGRSKETGNRPPGGNKRQIRGVPGLDVGHVYPDIDLPENFRLESASMNRARPGIAKRLGLTETRR